MLDRDLAILYGVDTAQLKRQVRRNIERFPSDFMFVLDEAETNTMVCHFGIPLERKYDQQFKVVFEYIKALLETPNKELKQIGFVKTDSSENR